ncbi:hypothetical protein [Alteribacillus bidgolensis]|uniref:LURP-one-related n=1 Tax=Alteribacillus bidgolensis TaxID=930129 RepID=A0A1G8IH16_9BACI|nr:hypothetical protein [Alteribacillus bidgolensis]SDI18051.1 hypothetical protein SAMN05216352_105187 [Alteribacillus bidgolensis]
MQAADEIYFSDNFFSAGITDIFDKNEYKIGQLDLKSAFTSSVDVIDPSGSIRLHAAFPLFSRRWVLKNKEDERIGDLSSTFSFFAKRFKYDAVGRGVYRVESEAFSHEFTMTEERGNNKIAVFEKISGFMGAPAYKLVNYSEVLSNDELIAVVMGVRMILKKRRNNNAVPPPGQ